MCSFYMRHTCHTLLHTYGATAYTEIYENIYDIIMCDRSIADTTRTCTYMLYILEPNKHTYHI